MVIGKGMAKFEKTCGVSAAVYPKCGKTNRRYTPPCGKPRKGATLNSKNRWEHKGKVLKTKCAPPPYARKGRKGKSMGKGVYW